jgi:peptidoglycan/LPS O-acetylase OafA/YrhL
MGGLLRSERGLGILTATPSSGQRLAGIEGTRAIAAGSILIFHVWLYSSPERDPVGLGPLGVVAPDLAYGVVLFFGLSGFLLYWPFAAAIVRRNEPPDARRYFWNRALRIIPAYWVILLLCSLVFQSALHPDGTTGALFDPLVLAQSMVFIQHYDPDQILTGIGPAWSLNVEVVFYLLLPLLGLVGMMLRRRVGALAAAFAPALFLLVAGLVGKGLAAYAVPPRHAFAGWESDWHSVLERSFLCQADLFAFGMALAVVRVLWEDGTLRLPTWWRLPAVLGASSALILITTLVTDNGQQLSYSPWNTVVALALAILLSLVVLVDLTDRRPPILVQVLEWRPLVLVGVVSYSVFLWHEPIVRGLQEHGLTVSGRAGFVANLAIVATVTMLLSIATYRFVEEPSLRRRARSRHDGPNPQPIAAEQAAP